MASFITSYDDATDEKTPLTGCHRKLSVSVSRAGRGRRAGVPSDSFNDSGTLWKPKWVAGSAEGPGGGRDAEDGGGGGWLSRHEDEANERVLSELTSCRRVAIKEDPCSILSRRSVWSRANLRRAHLRPSPSPGSPLAYFVPTSFRFERQSMATVSKAYVCIYAAPREEVVSP